MIGGTMLLSELESGQIPHALAIAIVRPMASSYLWPAQRTDGFDTSANRIVEGQRFRFDEDIEIDPNWSPMIKMMVESVRDYGLVVRDKAGAVVFYGEDPQVYGLGAAAYEPFMGGLPMWDVLKQFPWEKLVALQ